MKNKRFWFVIAVAFIIILTFNLHSRNIIPMKLHKPLILKDLHTFLH